MKAHSLYYSSDRPPPSYSYSIKHSKQNFPVPFFTSNAGQQSTAYQFSSLWNNLPLILKIIKNFLLFKKQLENHLLSAWPGELVCADVLLKLFWGLHAVSLATVHDGSIIIIDANFAVFMYLYVFVFMLLFFPADIFKLGFVLNLWKHNKQTRVYNVQCIYYVSEITVQHREQ